MTTVSAERPILPNQDILPSVLANGRILVDHLTSTMEVDGEVVGLTATELKVLELLIINRGSFVSTEKMKRAIYNGYASNRAGAVYVGYIRRKMGQGFQGVIKTKRFFGYKIDDTSLEHQPNTE